MKLWMARRGRLEEMAHPSGTAPRGEGGVPYMSPRQLEVHSRMDLSSEESRMWKAKFGQPLTASYFAQFKQTS